MLRAESIPAVGMVEDYVFPEAGEADGLAVTNGSEASITIPQELLLDRAEGENSTSMKTDTLYCATVLVWSELYTIHNYLHIYTCTCISLLYR